MEGVEDLVSFDAGSHSASDTEVELEDGVDGKEVTGR
jgi:hypothetical protein